MFAQSIKCNIRDMCLETRKRGFYASFSTSIDLSVWQQPNNYMTIDYKLFAAETDLPSESGSTTCGFLLGGTAAGNLLRPCASSLALSINVCTEHSGGGLTGQLKLK